MRSFGTIDSTSVQAERQGPSITTRSPEALTRSNSSRNGPTSPAGTGEDAHFGRRGPGRRAERHCENDCLYQNCLYQRPSHRRSFDAVPEADQD